MKIWYNLCISSDEQQTQYNVMKIVRWVKPESVETCFSHLSTCLFSSGPSVQLCLLSLCVLSVSSLSASRVLSPEFWICFLESTSIATKERFLWRYAAYCASLLTSPWWRRSAEHCISNKKPVSINDHHQQTSSSADELHVKRSCLCREGCTSSSCLTTIRPAEWLCCGKHSGNA